MHSNDSTYINTATDKIRGLAEILKHMFNRNPQATSNVALDELAIEDLRLLKDFVNNLSSKNLLIKTHTDPRYYRIRNTAYLRDSLITDANIREKYIKESRVLTELER
jgi:hypothetical protein